MKRSIAYLKGKELRRREQGEREKGQHEKKNQVATGRKNKRGTHTKMRV